MEILGYTDERNECDRCGKIELKGVYVIKTNEGFIKNLGSSCIAHAIEMDDNDEKLLKTVKYSIVKAKRNAKENTIIEMAIEAKKLGFKRRFNNEVSRKKYIDLMENNIEYKKHISSFDNKLGINLKIEISKIKFQINEN